MKQNKTRKSFYMLAIIESSGEQPAAHRKRGGLLAIVVGHTPLSPGSQTGWFRGGQNKRLHASLRGR